MGVILITVSGLWGTKSYVDFSAQQIRLLKEWLKIFTFWRDQIENYGFSVAEIISNLSKDASLQSLSVSRLIADKTPEEILAILQADNVLPAEQKTLIAEVIRELGTTLSRTQTERLVRAESALVTSIEEKEHCLKERSAMLYKLVPLLCGAVAVLLW